MATIKCQECNEKFSGWADKEDICPRCLAKIINPKATIINPNDPRDQIEITWCVEDVLQQNRNLSIKQARQVLRLLRDNHDATIGINWDVIDDAIDKVLDQELAKS